MAIGLVNDHEPSNYKILLKGLVSTITAVDICNVLSMTLQIEVGEDKITINSTGTEAIIEILNKNDYDEILDLENFRIKKEKVGYPKIPQLKIFRFNVVRT